MSEPDIDYEGLDQSEIESWQQSTISKVYPRLRAGLFHRTSIEGYRGIRESGYIVPNTGQFPYTYDQSKHSVTQYYGRVALFDFGTAEDQDCIRIYSTWQQFFFDQKPLTVVFRLNRHMLTAKLIPNTSGPQLGESDYAVYIPYVEAWYPEAIPFNAIEGFIISRSLGYGKAPVFREFAKDEVGEFQRHLLIEQIHAIVDEMRPAADASKPEREDEQ